MVCYKSGRPHFLPTLPSLAIQNNLFPQNRQASESNVYLSQSVYQHSFSGTEKKEILNQKQNCCLRWQEWLCGSGSSWSMCYPRWDFQPQITTCQLSCSQLSEHSLPSSYEREATTKQKGEQLVAFLLLQNASFLLYRRPEPEELLADLLIQGSMRSPDCPTIHTFSTTGHKQLF